MKFRIIIAGGRDFDDYYLLERKVNALLANYTNEGVVILSGKARGADKLGEQYAEKHNIDVHYFEADWDEYGERAGIMRNIEMEDV